MPSRGFTLVELVTVILIVSVLAVFVVPRFLGSSAFEGRTVQEQLSFWLAQSAPVVGWIASPAALRSPRATICAPLPSGR